jgi:hypothetical protein
MDFPLERVVSNRLEAITWSDLDPLNARACGRSQSRLQGSSRYFCAGTALNGRFGPLRNCVVQPMCVEEPAHMVNQPATVNDERHHYR